MEAGRRHLRRAAGIATTAHGRPSTPACLRGGGAAAATLDISACQSPPFQTSITVSGMIFAPLSKISCQTMYCARREPPESAVQAPSAPTHQPPQGADSRRETPRPRTEVFWASSVIILTRF